ncbi:MAG: hypothetical protein DMG97_33265 [Acidobacteria bacterium]|nr:MAG: hypothetical protein DMG97_33265 [Acidobacteriota bacterium]PYV74035.1 MAG: hypothetical protein DMG96_21350 [Acidobacteriota bacterium]
MGWFIGRYVYYTHMSHLAHKHSSLMPMVMPQIELKYDGFRALAIIEHGRAQLLSRNGHPFASFSALAESISDSLPNVRAVIDGEICSLGDMVDHSSKI